MCREGKSVANLLPVGTQMFGKCVKIRKNTKTGIIMNKI